MLGEEMGEGATKDIHLSTKKLKRCHSNISILGQFNSSPSVQTQFSSIYHSRLATLSPNVREASRRQWKNEKECSRVAALASEGESKGVVWVIGTVYMDMPLKPCILDEIEREQWIIAPLPRDDYTSAEDKVILEDESGRVVLTGDHLKEFLLCTGMIIGVLGKQLPSGTFQALDVSFPLLSPQPPLSIIDEGEWVALVSGLGNGVSHQLLSDYLTGELGDIETQTIVSKISSVVIMGGLLPPTSLAATTNKFGRKVATYDPLPISDLDTFISGLASNIDVIFVPGVNDATTALMPQRPIHTSLLSQAKGYSTLNCVSNPVLLQVDHKIPPSPEIDTGTGGPQILCTSGQILDDISKYVKASRLEIATSVIGCGVVSPTSPDTLWSQSGQKDVFCIKQIPSLFVVGNQPSFATRLIRTDRGGVSRNWHKDDLEIEGEGEVQSPTDGEAEEVVRILLLPKFSETGLFVLVNMSTLAVKTITLN